MSLKIKGVNGMWTPKDDETYVYGELDCALSSGNYELHSPAMEIVFHPKWVKKMNEIGVGDVVTDETGRVGLIMKEEKNTPGMIKLKNVRRFLVSFSGEEEVCHSFADLRSQNVKNGS